MATIIEILATDKVGDSRADLNTNFNNLDTDKLEDVTVTAGDLTGDGTSGDALTLASIVTGGSASYMSATVDAKGRITAFSTGVVALTFNEPAADNSAGTQGIFDSGTAGETVAFPNLLYLKSDGKWWKADADAAATMPGLRMALQSKNADETVSLLAMGRVRDDDWAWTVGGAIYASTTAGGLTQTAPSGTADIVQVVGYAYHADKMIFAPEATLVEIA